MGMCVNVVTGEVTERADIVAEEQPIENSIVIEQPITIEERVEVLEQIILGGTN